MWNAAMEKVDIMEEQRDNVPREMESKKEWKQNARTL